MKNKIVFIPGWMDTVENLVNWPGINIWKEKADINQKIEAEYVVGYSTGANWALANWNKNRNIKLVLVMPLIPKRKIRRWFFRWLKFEMFERSKISRKRSSCFPYIIQGISNLIRLMKIDPISIIDEIPNNNLIVIKGKNDDYFFDSESARIIELEEVGHNWNEKIISEVENLISSWK